MEDEGERQRAGFVRFCPLIPPPPPALSPLLLLFEELLFVRPNSGECMEGTS